jgi:RNA polymerase sigma-70 factor (ECF subfamily)
MTFEQLYTTYFPDVYRFAVWLKRDTTRAEDVASETFIRAWGRRDRLRTETLKGYLFAIARNIFIKQQRAPGVNERLRTTA